MPESDPSAACRPRSLSRPFSRLVLGAFRIPPLVTGAGGAAQTALELATPPVGAGLDAVTPGSSWTFQLFHRDATGPLGSGFNFSDAVRARFGT